MYITIQEERNSDELYQSDLLPLCMDHSLRSVKTCKTSVLVIPGPVELILNQTNWKNSLILFSSVQILRPP